MNDPIALLHSVALQELKRLTPAAHFWLREHKPEAFRELAEPLLRAPSQFGLTPRERFAAKALSAWATSEIETRKVYATLVCDHSERQPAPAMSKHDKVRLDAFQELFRRSALDFARVLNDALMIESFRPCNEADATPVPAAVDSIEVFESVSAASVPTQPIVTGTVVRHSTKDKRRDILDSVIEHAQSKCSDPKDTAQVYAQMEVLAQAEHPPLLAATPDGLKYSKNGTSCYLKRDALDKRLHPEKRKRRR